jgi:hypothetical protein
MVETIREPARSRTHERWMALSWAAGTAAALPCGGGAQPRALGVRLLQEASVAQGAELRLAV